MFRVEKRTGESKTNNGEGTINGRDVEVVFEEGWQMKFEERVRKLTIDTIDAPSDNIRRILLGPMDPVGTQNSKTGVPSTYRSIDKTCPTYCRYRDNGCYAQTSFTNVHQARAESTLWSSLNAAIYTMVLAANSSTAARLHVSGDFLRYGRIDKKYIQGLTVIGRTIQERYGTKWVAWSYTHIKRRDFLPYRQQLADSGIYVRFSDSISKHGTIVAEFEGLAQTFPHTRYIKCPAQLPTHLTCGECRACWEFPNHVIVFKPHGSGSKKILRVIQ